MKSYYVTAVDIRGKTVSEVIMAENNLEVVQIIQKQADVFVGLQGNKV
jgi:type II secretory pathway component PulF